MSQRGEASDGASPWVSNVGFTEMVTLGSMRCPGVVKLVLGLHHQRYEKVKFMMELHHGSSKECEASVGASSHGFLHPCEPVSGRLHKWDE